MYKRLFLVVVAMLIGAAVLVSANLLDNPGFEAADIHTTWFDGCENNNWFGWNARRVATDWTVPHDGEYSIVFEGWKTACGLEQQVPVFEGQVYRTTFYHLTDDDFTSGTPELHVTWLDASGYTIGSNVFSITLPSKQAQWYSAGCFDATSQTYSARAQIRIWMRDNGGEGTYYVDDVDFYAKD